MSKQLRLFGLLFVGAMLALALGLLSSISSASASPQAAPPAAVMAQSCDTSGTRDGSAVPTTILPSQTITFTAINFTPNEEVSFFFTLPDGSVFGTARPLCCAGSDGVVRFAPTTLPNEFYQSPGRWALTVVGASSNHTSVIYFCLATQAQATSTPVPPSATSVPATSTSVPATGTSVPVSPTAQATTTVSGETPTSVAGTPTGVATTPTVVASTPTTAATTVATTVPTAVEATPTTVASTPPPLPTEVVEPTPQVIEATPTVVGMPRTGQDDSPLLIMLVLMGASLLGIGWVARRRAPGTAR